MKIETFACDECGKRRDSDANHWWVLSADVSAVDLSNQEHAIGALLIMKWEDGIKHGNPPHRESHVCGQSCVIAAVNRFMSTGKLEK